MALLIFRSGRRKFYRRLLSTRSAVRSTFSLQQDTLSRRTTPRATAWQQTRSFNWPVENTNPNIMGNITVAQKGAKEGSFCMGCGVDIVGGNEEAAKEEFGFSVATSEKPKTFQYQQRDLWRKTKIENWSFCPRCSELQALEEEEHDDAHEPTVTPNTDDMDMTLLQLTPDHEMVRVFREHVKLVRGLRDAVVIVCADAVNTHGTMLTKIRNYVGGNTILLAVTRCDLLPPYVWQGGNDAWGITQVMRERAEHMQPAAIYFCSEERNAMRELGGVQQLVHDVWEKLNGRDLYIVGCANIGKSTLTEIIVRALLHRGELEGHFRTRQDRERCKALQIRSITKSALPGTTLSNIRVPCFQEFQQAVWDTPGLIVDTAMSKLIPMLGKKLDRHRARRPSPIEPYVHVEHVNKSVAFCICDDDGAVLVRFEVRLKKNDTAPGSSDDEPMRLVWNSTIPLTVRVMPIEDALREEEELRSGLEERIKEAKEKVELKTKMKQTIMDELGLKKIELDEDGVKSMSPEELAQARADRKSRNKEMNYEVFAECNRREIEQLGEEEYNRRKLDGARQVHLLLRDKQITNLVNIHQVVLDPNEGMDIMLANFGWLGVLMPRTAMVRVCTPKSGIKVGHFAPLALPPAWGDYKNSVKIGSNEEDVVIEEDEVDYDEWEGPEDVVDELDAGADTNPFGGSEGDNFSFQQESDNVGTDGFGLAHPLQFARRFVAQNENVEGNPWDVYRGERVGWLWDDNPRFHRGKTGAGWNPIPENWAGKDIRANFRSRHSVESQRNSDSRGSSRSSKGRSNERGPPEKLPYLDHARKKSSGPPRGAWQNNKNNYPR